MEETRWLLELARRENVVYKVYRMVTEADWERWRDEDLERYFDVAVEAFGPSRLMVGSDWPWAGAGISTERPAVRLLEGVDGHYFAVLE